jgi:hypothetical protein
MMGLCGNGTTNVLSIAKEGRKIIPHPTADEAAGTKSYGKQRQVE